MLTNALRFAQLALYVVIASQLIFYLLILSDALKQVSLSNFIELRRVVDISMGHRFKIIYYAGLALSLSVLLVHSKQPGSVLFITYAIAFVCLCVDVVIALKGNVPINRLFNHYQASDTHNWAALRTEWLYYINLRALAIITGTGAQLAALLWHRPG